MKASEISEVTVIGAGTMGAGIAGEFARAGCNVRLMDKSDEQLQRGRKMLDAAQKSLMDAGLLSALDARQALGRITTHTAIEEACSETDFVIEAVFEDMALKKKLFGLFNEICPVNTIIVTNSSGLSITEMASAAKQSEFVAGMHFWNPPHIIPLVEVTKGEKTSDSTANFVIDICNRIGKRPILVKHDIPGFVGNRLQFAVLREALHILSEGIASAEDVETAMTAGPGLRYSILGPLRTADLGGLDVFHAISTYLFPELCSDDKPPKLLTELVQNKNMGAKTGKGFFTYSETDLHRIISQRDTILLKMLKILKEQEGR
ncbi:MAG: 3-hydroxyacyl-CoA dehydrogenase family protein [Candidatus Latescibacteria bacterium]|nr:3-hydroxyacyl-CoA dehydrogenase family protein [Candidatus Latescibacterota bacterium]